MAEAQEKSMSEILECILIALVFAAVVWIIYSAFKFYINSWFQ